MSLLDRAKERAVDVEAQDAEALERLAEPYVSDRIRYISEDEDLAEQLNAAGLPELKPLASHLLSLTKLDKHAVKSIAYRLRAVLCLAEALGEDRALKRFIAMEAVAVPLLARLYDSLDGWKLQNAIKSVRVLEVAERRRRWI